MNPVLICPRSPWKISCRPPFAATPPLLIVETSDWNWILSAGTWIWGRSSSWLSRCGTWRWPECSRRRKCPCRLRPGTRRFWRTRFCFRAAAVATLCFLAVGLSLKSTNEIWIWWAACPCTRAGGIGRPPIPEVGLGRRGSLLLCIPRCNACRCFRGTWCLFGNDRNNRTYRIPGALANWHSFVPNRFWWQLLPVNLRFLFQNTTFLCWRTNWSGPCNKTCAQSLLAGRPKW